MYVTGAFYVTTGSVGIGTISPSNKLTVIGTDGADTTPATYGGTIKIVDYGVSGPQAVGGLEFRDSAGYGSKIFTNSTSDYLGFASRLGSATWTGSMVIKQATGNVGIGTESPNYKLHIHNPDSSDTRFQITNTTTGTTGGVGIQLITFGNDAVLSNRSNGYFVFETNSTERMRISSGGDVSIGSSTIYNGGGWARVLSLYDASSIAISLVVSAKQYQVGIAGTDNDFRIYDFTGSTYRFVINGSTGNIGIATTTPDQKLTIQAAGTANGLISFKNSAGTTIAFVGAPNTTGDVISTSTSADLCLRNETGNILFSTSGNAEKMRITAGGNVGIGTASPAEKLHLYDASYPRIRMSAGAAATDSYYLNPTQGASFYITNVSTGNGAYLVYNSSSGWTGVSDARWKTNWTDINGALSLISRLNIGKYKMLNNDKEIIENARWDYGIKAQELLDIIPDAVDVQKK
jgi:hypothetical protein